MRTSTPLCEERTIELNSKYKGLNLEDLVEHVGAAVGGRGLQGWTLNFSSCRSVDNYFMDTLRACPSKVDKITKAPKQIAVQVFQFFPAEPTVLQERELAAHK
ncbi:unnamed protein product [Cyclocybe aegerita]|uniref:ISWI HAND domain-containing protein n=1 Tax=Cyclocybe aegerita TaxID=1973307 RepID=A0A8S0VUF2_CYCAE|nr:unnamed protein product [Cyclocybe aegerita]